MDGFKKSISSQLLTESIVNASGALNKALSCLDALINESTDRNGHVDNIASLIIRARAITIQAIMEIERQQKKGIL